MKVLLVDDSSTMRKIQKNALKGMAFEEIKEAENGRAAIDILKEINFEVSFMICDINMPIMSGIEALKEIRAMPAGQDLPILMCTSVADKGQVIEAIKSGANGYVVKPFKPDELCAKVTDLIEKFNIK
ncbi:MAG: response regulator [Lentisphaeria bacterium]|nr:response regulator [Lentisphaeria bacterium]